VNIQTLATGLKGWTVKKWHPLPGRNANLSQLPIVVDDFLGAVNPAKNEGKTGEYKRRIEAVCRGRFRAVDGRWKQWTIQSTDCGEGNRT